MNRAPPEALRGNAVRAAAEREPEKNEEKNRAPSDWSDGNCSATRISSTMSTEESTPPRR